jgi:hypothetical protein
MGNRAYGHFEKGRASMRFESIEEILGFAIEK